MNHGGGCEEDERERGKTKVDLETSKKGDLGRIEGREGNIRNGDRSKFCAEKKITTMRRYYELYDGKHRETDPVVMCGREKKVQP
ncbi:hypothetical protein F2Q70_00013114 [Brassica cretica]|uniref:Uncharacterized protein n=1 Tax=Brassica cretica TaxID=69181 RepID=A0A8S9M4J7_BRACR|nr:hypothetical protein F2Q70_00013114 [Brassica cretica]